MWFNKELYLPNGSREKKQKTTTEMGEGHRRYIWKNDSSKQKTSINITRRFRGRSGAGSLGGAQQLTGGGGGGGSSRNFPWSPEAGPFSGGGGSSKFV